VKGEGAAKTGDATATSALSVRRTEAGGILVQLEGRAARKKEVERFLDETRSLIKAAGKEVSLKFDGQTAEGTASGTAATVLSVIQMARAQDLDVDLESLPESLRPLIKLAMAVPRRGAADAPPEGLVSLLGRQAVAAWATTRRFIDFLGELIFSFGKLLTGRSCFRKRDFWITLQDCGAGALPIVSLLAILTGTILGFVGAVQLRKFGATIYMTDLVGLSMAREMAAIMTGVIMAGRTGAAFAAQIGSMKVNQEIDALETLGISPVEFLVLPRTLALILMMPLLTLYANVLGWTGGLMVALPMNINAAEYWNQLIGSISLNHIIFGISKSFFFGIVIATTGCYYGLRSARSSAAVGTATTRAVVAGITWIIVLDAVFAFMDELLNY
jgi:phospholipid/cholesterol/gamma-HCH transport system permease protein